MHQCFTHKAYNSLDKDEVLSNKKLFLVTHARVLSLLCMLKKNINNKDKEKIWSGAANINSDFQTVHRGKKFHQIKEKMKSARKLSILD